MCLLCTDEVRLKGWAEPIIYPNDPFGDVVRKYDKELSDLARLVAEGRVAHEDFEDAMREILGPLHLDSHYAGQEMSEQIAPSRTLARSRAKLIEADQVQYARGFALALAERDARYWDEVEAKWNQDAITARTRSYLARARATACDGWVSATYPTDFVRWTLGAVEESCEDCPWLASRGPYRLEGSLDFSYEVLPYNPGDGETECGPGCKCHLTRVSDDAMSPTAFQFQQAAA